ncbi:MAG: hypothetical protein FJ083_05535 [Cyanobacteria bacterium K_Offshore_surface_m2_239]|nr:hypothetical protein [Cyanobacteria bacterium K_Offshore_surface_m2_239]
MARHEAVDACVILVILRPSDWSNTALGRLEALPANAKPVTNWSNRDEAFLSIACGIREVAQRLAERPRAQPTATTAHPVTPSVPVPSHPTPDSEVGGARLEIPEGPVRQDSFFYIRPVDEDHCRAELVNPGALIRIKSPKGFGKSSHTAGLLAHAQTLIYRTVALNLVGTDQKFFQDPDRFMQWFCAAAGKLLGLRVRTEDYWDDIFVANDNSTDYVVRH